MAHQSKPEFRTFHALRIKGFATSEVLVDMTGTEEAEVDEHLADLLRGEMVQFQSFDRTDLDIRCCHRHEYGRLDAQLPC